MFPFQKEMEHGPDSIEENEYAEQTRHFEREDPGGGRLARQYRTDGRDIARGRLHLRQFDDAAGTGVPAAPRAQL
ncbi:hypothetical protein MASSI9I_100161 [Massilia sp. 9I]|nr:hypothetical protein MASSI9I_100161 [Massilia sp. 9I]